MQSDDDETGTASTHDNDQSSGYEIVAIDQGPTVLDDGDRCERCGAGRVAGETSWLVEYAHGELKDVCSACASKLEVGAIDRPAVSTTENDQAGDSR